MSKFIVWCEDSGDSGPEDGDEIEAFDAESAAEEWAEREDSDGDYWVCRDGGVAVIVRDESGVDHKIKVWGEATITYHSRKIS